MNEHQGKWSVQNSKENICKICVRLWFVSAHPSFDCKECSSPMP